MASAISRSAGLSVPRTPFPLYKSNSVVPCAPTFYPALKLGRGARNGGRLKCRSSIGPGGSSSGDNESKSVLDAFFLGKAVAEALSERIESTVGEFLSTVGRLQVEQQKQVQEFQDEVLERAKRAKEKAARDARESQGLPIKSTTTTNTSLVVSSPTTPSASLSSPKTITLNTTDSTSGKDDSITLNP